MNRALVVMTFLILSVVGCSSEPEPETKQENVFNPYVKSYEKGKQAEQLILDGAEAQRQRIEEQTR